MNVVITGATKGIGRAIAETFADAGYCIIACARSQKDLLQMEENFAKRFPAVALKTFAADIGNVTEIHDFANWITGSGDAVDILVNNAGHFIAGSINNEAEGTLLRMLEVNLYAAYHLTRALLPGMIKRRQGHIFTICSTASFTPSATIGAYGISKYALYGFTKILREEMKPHRVKVTAVCPGSTLTASWEGADVDPAKLLEAADIAKLVLAASQLSLGAVAEDIILRPVFGDL